MGRASAPVMERRPLSPEKGAISGGGIYTRGNGQWGAFMHRFASAFILAVGAVLLAGAAQAQSLAGLRIGDDISATARMGEPAATEPYNEYTRRAWASANGNELSVSFTAAGKIAFMEIDWGGRPEGAATDMFGFVFGKTRLSDIRSKLGSNGLMFKNRTPLLQAPDGLVLLNSYEVGTAVVTFYSHVAQSDFDRARSDSGAVADLARLIAISVASDAYYAGDEGGERIYDPAYKKIDAP